MTTSSAGGHVPLASNVIVQYGLKGMGKTTDAIRTCPTALFFGPERSIRNTAASSLGITDSCGLPWPIVDGKPRVFPRIATGRWGVSDLQSLTARLTTLATPAKGSDQPRFLQLDIPAVVVDEVSSLALATLADLSLQYPDPKQMWDKFRDYAAIVNAWIASINALAVHIPIILSGHEKEAGADDKGVPFKGGILLGAKARMGRLDQECDTTARIRRDPNSIDPWHPYCYEIDYDNPKYHTRNRFGWKGTVPANLRAMLLESNQRIRMPRLPGLEAQDDIAEEVAVACKGATSAADVLSVVGPMEERHNALLPHPLHVQWAWQDGIAMAALRAKANQSVLVQPAAGKRRPPPL